MKDKRRWPRVSLELPAKFALVIPGYLDASPAMDSIVLDLSERGVLVETSLPHASFLEMLKELRWCRISLAEQDLPRQIIGKIVWIDRMSADEEARYKLGVYLEDLRPADQLQLQQFVAASRSSSTLLN